MKECFLCKEIKPLDDFYAHPRMSDGHLNKCKECCKRQAKERHYFLEENDLEWVEKELARQRAKRAKARLEGRTKKSTEVYLSWVNKNPSKRKAQHMVSNAVRDKKLLPLPCSICGEKAQAHHEDYSKPLDVVWLCTQHHSERHVEINRIRRRELFLKRQREKNSISVLDDHKEKQEGSFERCRKEGS